MFNYSKYRNTYYRIINQAADRPLLEDVKIETHHIMPKCLGGGNEPSNLVKLLPREHFLCHWLLTKMVDNKKHQHQMWNAFGLMLWMENDKQERYKISGRTYQLLKEHHSKMKSWALKGEKNGFYGKHHTDEAKKRISEANKGSKLTPEQCEKVRQSKLGTKHTPEAIKKMSENRKGKTLGDKNGMFGKQHSEETKRKISEAAKNRVQSKETKAKIAKARTGKKHSPETIERMKQAWVKRRAKL